MDFADAFLGENGSGRSSNRHTERRTWQFCRQVQRALNLALADTDGDSGMGGLFVEDVLPAPDCGRLLVHILVPPGLDVTAALADLRQQGPRLRAEVARAITRKRAPELTFAPALSEGGSDE